MIVYGIHDTTKPETVTVSTEKLTRKELVLSSSLVMHRTSDGLQSYIPARSTTIVYQKIR